MQIEKCINCNSTNIVNLKSYNSSSREFIEEKKIAGGYHTTRGSVNLWIKKYLCLDCEHIFEIVDKSSLNEYKDKMKFFV